MKRIITTLAVALACIGLAPGVRAADDAALKVFDQIYGPKVKAAIASLDKADDHALVAEFTRLASDNNTDEALAIVMFTQGYDLAMRDAGGARLAADAMAALASRIEAQRAFAAEKRIDALNLLLLRGKAEEREEAGGEMVDLLIEQGDTQASEGKYTEAGATYRRAILATGRIKSRSADDIKPRMETVLQQARAAKQVEIYRAKLLENRSDTATAEALVKVYLTELDDAKAAGPYLEIVKDETLKKIATLAAKAVGELEETEAMALAEWYYAQSRGAKGLAEAVTLARTKESLERFLALHTATDLARSKALAMTGEIQKKVVRPMTRPGGQEAPSMPSGAILLMSFESKTILLKQGKQHVQDISGNDHDGLIEGAKPTTGRAGGGLQFDGRDDHVSIEPLYATITRDLKAISFSVWIKMETTRVGQFVFDVGLVGTHSITIRLADRWEAMFAAESGGAGLASGKSFDTDWHHLAMTWDGSEISLYIDGELGESKKTQLDAITKKSLAFGMRNFKGNRGGDVPQLGCQAKDFQREERMFQGVLDEFAVFNRGLSAKEIRTLHEAGKAGIHFGQYK